MFQDVFDKDVFQNDFMGTVSLSVDEVKDASKVNLLFLPYLFVLLHAKWAINRLVPRANKSKYMLLLLEKAPLILSFGGKCLNWVKNSDCWSFT